MSRATTSTATPLTTFASPGQSTDPSSVVDTTVAGMLLIGDPWVTHPDSSVLELSNRTNCRGVGPEDHPLLLAVQGEAVVEELGALLTPVAALGAAVGAKPSRLEKTSKV